MRDVPRFVGAINDPDRPMGVALVNRRGRLMSANAAMIEALGEGSSLLNTNLSELAGFVDAGLQPLLERALKERHASSLRATHYRSRSGREFLLDVEFHPIFGADGEVAEVVVVFSDVTAGPYQGRAAMFYQAFLHSSNAIEITDRDGVYVDVNPAFERIYGYRREELVGQRPRLISSPKTPRQVFTDMWAALVDPARGDWAGEIINLDRNGREHPVVLEVSALRNAQGELAYFVVGRDRPHRTQTAPTPKHSGGTPRLPRPTRRGSCSRTEYPAGEHHAHRRIAPATRLLLGHLARGSGHRPGGRGLPRRRRAARLRAIPPRRYRAGRVDPAHRRGHPIRAGEAVSGRQSGGLLGQPRAPPPGQPDPDPPRSS